MTKRLLAALMWIVAAALWAVPAHGQDEVAAKIEAHLSAGTLSEGLAELTPLAEDGNEVARFGVGVLTFFKGVETLAQPLYRHGFNPRRGVGSSPFLGVLRGEDDTGPAPEPLTYAMLRDYLDAFSAEMDAAKTALIDASEGANFAVEIDVMNIRVDIDADGVAGESESVGAFLAQTAGLMAGLDGAQALAEPPATTFAFDNADAIWLAGYSQILAVQADFLLAHDFETFFDAVMHRFFPGAGLPMEQRQSDGMLFMDRESDALIADMIAAIHTINWPVEDGVRLRRVQERALEVISLSRRNWDAILAETDDHLEFMPAPTQTPIDERMAIDKAMIKAWLETLDATERILTGDLLLPHWRYSRLGFDLDAYFNTATRTDLVMLLTGLDALPYLKEGPIADADSFAAANAVFGEALWRYALWFN